MPNDEAEVAPPRGFEVLPLGSPAPELVRDIVRELSRRVAVPCHLLPAPKTLVLPKIAGRQQVDADKLLAALEKHPRREGHWLLGLTDADIGHPIFTFFFGRARHHGGAALVSLARLAQSFYGLPEDLRLLAHRAVMESVHELGHVAGLAHCDDNRCLMRFCTSVEVADNRGETFCGLCGPELPPAFRPSLSAKRA